MFISNLGSFFTPLGSGKKSRIRIRIHGLKISRILTDPDPKHNLLLQELKVEVATFTGHTLYNPKAIIAKNQGAVPLTYQKLQVGAVYCTVSSW